MGFVSFLEENLLACQFKSMGVECMGCGLQRSVVLILKGEFAEAFYMYPAIYSLIFMFGFLLLHLKFQFAKGHKVLLWLFIVNLLIIITNYILRII
jgi:hypothetical protein